MGVGVHGAGADAVVLLCVGDVVPADPGQVEIDVRAMFAAEGLAAAEDRRQIRAVVAVTVSHAAAPQHLRRVEQPLIVFLVLLHLVEKVAELLDQKHFGRGETAELLGGAVVMAQAVASLQDADLGSTAGASFATDAAGDDARRISADGHDHQIEEETVLWQRTQRACRQGSIALSNSPGEVAAYASCATAISSQAARVIRKLFIDWNEEGQVHFRRSPACVVCRVSKMAAADPDRQDSLAEALSQPAGEPADRVAGAVPGRGCLYLDRQHSGRRDEARRDAHDQRLHAGRCGSAGGSVSGSLSGSLQSSAEQATIHITAENSLFDDSYNSMSTESVTRSGLELIQAI